MPMVAVARACTLSLVDDEAPIRLLCRVNLEAEGMTVLEAAASADPAARTVVRVAGGDPSTRLRELLVALGDEAPALDAVEIVRPSLEAAYLALTGRRAAVASDVAAAEQAA